MLFKTVVGSNDARASSELKNKLQLYQFTSFGYVWWLDYFGLG